MIWYLGELADNPPALFAYIAAFVVALVLGIAFHEFCHAWAAYELGDSTAARQGRLTLNPLVHIEPTGMLLLLLVGFGWGRPTPVNPYNLRVGPRRGNALVALAGPASNFVFAVLAALPLRLGWVRPVDSLDEIANASGSEIAGLFLFFIVIYNVLLGVFNLIPIHPLDGFKVVVGVAPREVAQQLERLAPYGPGILMTLLVVGFIAPQFNVLGWFIRGMQDRVLDLLF
jgi:Zn-dependent protease